MFEVKAKLTREEFEIVENLIFESEGMEHWNLYENFDDKGFWAQGVYETEAEAVAGKAGFQGLIQIAEELIVAELEDKDWKESYKEHFKPWAIGELHWAPLWLKDEYELPAGHEAVWLDPGMAFGTGNHGTTRLCVEQLIAFKETGRDAKTSRVADAGCGSGILAISAAKLGFEQIGGFDIDGDAVRIAEENAEINGVSRIRFSVGGLEDGLSPEGSNCLMANILANILMQNSKLLIDSVAPGGWLILSG
ncbi:MAG: 50S ribosomal protein L11 methyltransferase, partial [Verrucomicrobiia bacterium]